MIGKTNALIESDSSAEVVDTISLKLTRNLTEYSVPEGARFLDPYALWNSGYNVGGTKITISDSIERIYDYALANFFDNTTTCSHTIVNIPPNLTMIGEGAFQLCILPTNTVLPEGLPRIDKLAFNRTTVNSVTIPSTVKSLPDQCFYLSKVVSVTLTNGVQSLNGRVFEQCINLKNVFIPNSITNVHASLNPFMGCTSLEFVTIENGFNANNLNLSSSTKYSAETIVSWLNALADRTGLSTYTLKIGATNLNKLTTEEKAIASDKNWNLA